MLTTDPGRLQRAASVGSRAVAEAADDVFEGIASQGLGPHPPVPEAGTIHGYAGGGSPRSCAPALPARRRRRSALRCFWRSSASLRRQDSPSMAMISALWTRRSTRATRQAALGKALTPLGEGPVGGDYGGVLLAAAGDDVEQQIGMAVAVGQVSDLVDHQQVLAGVEAQPALKQGVAVEGGELAEHAGRGGEAHGVALEDGAVGDIGGDGRLADAVWADQDDVGGLVEELEAHEILDGHAVAAARPCPVEVGERL